MNLTTEDYEKINNLIQTNEDENKAIAAGIIANMDKEQFLDWLQSFIDLYYPDFESKKFLDSVSCSISNFYGNLKMEFNFHSDGGCYIFLFDGLVMIEHSYNFRLGNVRNRILFSNDLKEFLHEFKKLIK